MGGLGGKWAVVVAGRVVGLGSFFFLRTGTGRARENVLVLPENDIFFETTCVCFVSLAENFYFLDFVGPRLGPSLRPAWVQLGPGLGPGLGTGLGPRRRRRRRTNSQIPT